MVAKAHFFLPTYKNVIIASMEDLAETPPLLQIRDRCMRYLSDRGWEYYAVMERTSSLRALRKKRNMGRKYELAKTQMLGRVGVTSPTP